ncbi:MAG: glycoside hydrolase 100 family protein [Saprospiraceae bacterium]
MKNMIDSAKDVIYRAIREDGILASAYTTDNYNRVWSRDAMMTGIVGQMYDDATIIDGFKKSIITLAQYQHDNGTIPSNVGKDNLGLPLISYGTLVGRTDATIWWIIGTISMLSHDIKFHDQFQDFIDTKLTKALGLLEAWEFNNRGLIYSPLGGNWADEYVTSGYTLYDNVLYLWALELAAVYFDSTVLLEKSKRLRLTLKVNFDNHYVLKGDEKYYHASAIEIRKKNLKPYFSAALSPAGFDQRWDMAGNALALVLQLFDDPNNIVNHINALMKSQDSMLLPVFYPVIEPDDLDWHLLQSNFSYSFKNYPYQFHNGGFWPIFSGWLCYGLRKYNDHNLANKLMKAYESVLTISGNKFFEYHDIRNGEAKGVEGLCFSASGYLLMAMIPKNIMS